MILVISKFRHQDLKIVTNNYVAGNFLNHYIVVIFRKFHRTFATKSCVFLLAKVFLKFQRATFGDFEIVYYQWKGFLSSERLMEASELCLNLFRLYGINYTVIERYDSYGMNYSSGLVVRFENFFR